MSSDLKQKIAAHLAAGELAEAATALEALAVATVDPAEEARVLSELGRVRLRLNDAEQAALALARAIWLAPKDGAQLLKDLPGDRALVVDVLDDLATDALDEAKPFIQAAKAALP